MSDAVFNTKEIQDGVNAIEKSFDHLTREIEKLNSQKINSIQRELAKLGGSAKTSVQEMAASLKSGLDEMLQAQIAFGNSTTNAQRAANSVKLADAKNAFTILAMVEREAYRDSLTEQKTASTAKIAAKSTENATLKALQSTADAAAVSAMTAHLANLEKKEQIASANDLAKNVKYVVDLETARQQIAEKGTSTMLRGLARREESIRRLLEMGTVDALILAEKKYGTDFVAKVQHGLDKETSLLLQHNESLAAIRKAEELAVRQKAAEALTQDFLREESIYQAHRAKVVEGLQADFLREEAVYQAHRAKVAEGLLSDFLREEAIYQAHKAKTAEGLLADFLKEEAIYQAHQAKLIEGLQSDFLREEAIYQAHKAKTAEGLIADFLKEEAIYQAHQAKIAEGLQSDFLREEAAYQAHQAKIASGLEADKLKEELIYQVSQAKIVSDTQDAMSKLWAVEKAGRKRLTDGLEADKLKEELVYQVAQAKIVSDTEDTMSKLWAIEKAGRARLIAGLEADKLKEELVYQAAQAKVISDTEEAMSNLWAVEKAGRARMLAGLEADKLKEELIYQATQAKIAADDKAAKAKLLLENDRFQVAAAYNLTTDVYQKYDAGSYRKGGLVNAVKASSSSATSASTVSTESASYVAAYAAALGSMNKASLDSHAGIQKSSTLLQAFSVDARDAHAAVRGLSQGFGSSVALYGSILPLLAGTAVASVFVKSLKQGSEFAEKLFVIGELAGASTVEVEKLAQASLRLGATTQYGPLEVAEALKVLSLAGLNAEKALSALKPTLDFAAAGGVTTEAAASTLVAVATAYRYSAESFSVVGDIIAKTAADTQASVADMSEAFKSSSVLAQQYGVTLEETAQALGMMAQIGIKGSAAGTSWRNMLTEFNKGSGKAAEGIREMGVEMKNFDGTSKPIFEVMQSLTKGLIQKTSTVQDRILQDITNERGAKATAAFQSQVLATLHKTNPLLQEQADYYFKIGDKAAGNKLLLDATDAAYEKMAKKQKESGEGTPNFSFLANLEGQFTPLKLMAGLSASFGVSLTEAFKESEGAVVSFGMSLREALNSEGFKSSMSAIVSGVMTTVTAFKDGIILVVEAVAWAYDHMLMTTALAIGTYAAALAVAMVATKAAALVMAAYTGATVLATLAVNALNASMAIAGIGLGLTLGGFVLITAAVVATIAVIGSLIWNYNEVAETAEESADRQKKAKAKVAEDAISGLEAVIASQKTQLADKLKADTEELDRYNSNAAIQKAVNAELRLSFEARKKGDTAAAEAHETAADKLRATMVSSEEARVKAQGEALRDRINQWATYREALADVLHDESLLDSVMRKVHKFINPEDAKRSRDTAIAQAKSDIQYSKNEQLRTLDSTLTKQTAVAKDKAANSAADAKTSGTKLQGVDGKGGYVGKKPADKKNGSGYEDDTSLNDLKVKLAKIHQHSALVIEDLNVTDKLFEASRAAGYVDDKAYYGEKIRLAKELSKAKQDELSKDIETRKAHVFTGKKADSNEVANQAAIIDLQTKLNTSVKESGANIAILGAKSDDSLQKITRGYVDAQKAAENFLDTLKRTNAREMQGFTMGDRKFAQVNAEGSITEKAQSELNKLDLHRESLMAQSDGKGNTKFTEYEQNDYNKKITAAYRLQQAELEISREMYDKKTAMRANYDAGAKKALENYMEQTQDVYGQVNSIVGKSLSGIEDNLTTMLTTGKTDFKSFAASILADITRMIVKQMIFNQLVAAKEASANGGGGMLGSMFRIGASALLGGVDAGATSTPMQTTPDYPTMNFGSSTYEEAALGNVYTSPSLSAYSGQIVSSPTTFAFAKGAGIMGEAGPEAIMPLTRGSNGKLGVQSVGKGATGGDVNVSVTVDATGSKAAGDDKRANQLGDMIGGAVRNILVQEKRPGGILA